MEEKNKKTRKERRRDASYQRRLKRDFRMGHGKRALDGKRFRFIHVSWIERIAKEMKQNKLVQERFFLMTKKKLRNKGERRKLNERLNSGSKGK